MPGWHTTCMINGFSRYFTRDGKITENTKYHNLNGFRVYIAKITFTTLIDHFTSYMPKAPVMK